MKMLEEILAYNEKFVESKSYEKFKTSKYPKKKLVILSCMDTRLTELLPNSLNLKNGDAKIINNAGAVITHPFGSAMRSIIVAIYELHAEEVCVIGHHGCGMSNIDPEETILEFKKRGISQETIKTLENSGIELKNWLHGFDCVADSVRDSVEKIKNHPLMPEGIAVHGLVIDPETGKLEVVVNGYLAQQKNVAGM